MTDPGSIKAAFFDIDGTLVSIRTHRIGEKDIAALDALRAKGIKIIIATGRHISIVDNVPYPIDGITNCNGALAYLAKGGPAPVEQRERFEVVGDTPFPAPLAERIATIVTENHIPTVTFLKDRAVINEYDEVSRTGLEAIKVPVMPEVDIVPAVKECGAYSFCAFVHPDQEEEYFSEVLPLIETSRWCDAFADINVKGTDKGKGLEKVCAALGISPEQTIAFGDGGNDIPLLRRAGIGVAMGNAGDHVKAAADYVTCDVESCGIAAALQKLGIIQPLTCL